MATQLNSFFSMPMACSLDRPPTLPILNKHRESPGCNINRRRIVGRSTTPLKVASKEVEVFRRSGNYQPPVWDYNLFQSYTSAYNINDEEQMKQIKRLKEDVKVLFGAKMGLLAKLELIDSVQRLGLEYHFEKEVATAIDSLYNHDAQHPSWTDEDLYTNALKFRIFRQKGLVVSEDVLRGFKEKHEESKRAALHDDVKVLLSLYEASFLGYEDEATIDEIRNHATTEMKNLSQASALSDFWERSVDHALDMPLHWRLNRMEAKWYINVYEKEEHMNPSLLHLAKLDYNVVQSTYLQEVQELIRWWLDMGLNEISFARDRTLEHYLWSSAMAHEPQFRDARIGEAKIASLITLVDDVYDVYGSLEELELFTDIVNRWDISRVDELPPPVRTVLLAMFNTSNEIGYKCIKKNGFNGTRFMSKAWADLCNAYMQEAKWYHGGYIPTLDEYLRTSIVSISGPLMLSGFYVLSTDKVRDEALKYIEDVQCVVRCCATMFRLTNDLGTSKDELARGDVMKAVECYMKEAGVGEEAARQHIIELVERTWKIMNKAITGSYPFPDTFVRASQNLVKISQYFYKNGDGHGINPGDETKEHLMTLLLLPVPIDGLMI